MNQKRTFQIAIAIWTAAFLLLVPVLLPEFHVHLVSEILIFALFAVSFNLLFGYGGMLPFGHAAFFGMGAYVTALIFNHLPGTPLLLVFLLSALASFLAGVIIGAFCVRRSGVYFALISQAFQMFLFAIALKWRAVTHGDDGMSVVRPDLHLGFIRVSMLNIENVYYLTLFIVLLAIFACYFFLKTPLGNSVVSMRENDLRASFLGYNTFMTKLIVYSFAAGIAGLAGALFVFFLEFVGTTSIDLNMCMTVVFMAVLGGTGHFLGPVLGAAFYIVLQNWMSSLTSHWWLFMGTLFIIVILYLEEGLISLFNKIRWYKIRLRFNRTEE